jgi:glycosyltransferase involved in cell wall biosynthesis
MRILHIVTNSDLGGAPRVVTELSAQAVQEGHACGVAAMPGGPMWEHLEKQVERFPVPSMRRDVEASQDIASLGFLRRLYRSYEPDVIHLHSSKAGVLGRLAALSMGLARRTVYTIHGFDTILKTHQRYLPLERMLAWVSGAIVPVSRYDFDNLRAVGIQKRVLCIPNGVSDRRGKPSPDAEAVQAISDSRSSGRPVILSIARVEKPKRPDLYAALARLNPQADFYWVGNVQDPLESMPGIQIPPNLRFLGESPEAGNLANLCDLFVLLSDYEGIPMSVLEAMSCAKPVLASKVGGIPEALGEGSEAGGLMVANEAPALHEALKKLLESTALRQGMGTAGRKRYEVQFSAAQMWTSYRNLYRTLGKA